MSSLGWRHEGAAHGQHLLFAAREGSGGLLPAFSQDGEEVVGALDVLLDACLVVAQEGAELEVFGDGQAREDVPALGGVGEAEGDDLVGGDAGEGLAVEEDLAAGRLEEARRGCAGWWSCRRRWCR